VISRRLRGMKKATPLYRRSRHSECHHQACCATGTITQQQDSLVKSDTSMSISKSNRTARLDITKGAVTSPRPGGHARKSHHPTGGSPTQDTKPFARACARRHHPSSFKIDLGRSSWVPSRLNEDGQSRRPKTSPSRSLKHQLPLEPVAPR